MCLGEGVLAVVLPDMQINSLGEEFTWGRKKERNCYLVNFLVCVFIKMKASENIYFS